jgi:hypothetical protein
MLAWLPVFPSFSTSSAPQEAAAPVSTTSNASTSALADPLNQLQERVQFLQNGFFQPTTSSSINTVNANAGTTLTPAQCIEGQFLNRTGTLGAPVNDTTPSASDLLVFLKKYVNPVVVSQGFSWNISYWNQTSQPITLLPGTGVTIGTSILFASNKVSTLRVYVLNADAGSEAVYISFLGN